MTPSSESIALAKLREAHREEYDFYLRRAEEDRIKDWKDLPSFPVNLQSLCLSEYIEAALEIAEYEPDGEVILARVPGVEASYFTQGEDYEDAKEMLADAIEGNALIALQMGWKIPPIPGSEAKIEIVEINSA